MVAASVFADPHDWGHSVQWAAAREAAWGAAGRECPVLVGEAVEGASFAGYVAAARLALGSGVDPERVTELAEGGVVGSVTEVDRAALASLAPAVSALREAAHRRGGARSWPAPDVAPGANWELFELMVVVDALRWEARELASQGRFEGAIDYLLDGVACGVDLAHSLSVVEQMLGMLALDRCLRGFDGALLAAAPPAVLQRLGAALAVVDGVLPPESTCMTDSIATMVLALARTEAWSARDVGLSTPLVAWRHGFSVRRLAMAHAVQLAELAMRFERETPAGEPWSARQLRLQRAAAQARQDSGALPQWSFDHVLRHEEQRREIVTQVRLLRLAVVVQLGQPTPELADPFGDGALQVVPTATGSVVTSERAGLQRAVFSER
jgi:hypothetical protein